VVESLFLAGGALSLAAAVAPLLWLRLPGRIGRQAGLWLMLGGSTALAAAGIVALLGRSDTSFLLFRVSQQLSLSFRIDSLAAFFIVIIGVVSACAAVYSMSYIEHYGNTARAHVLISQMSVFILSMAAVVASANTFGFLFFWEIMSLSSFLLVMFEREAGETPKAGLFYFIMTQLGTAFLFAAFLMLFRATGSFDIAAASGISAGLKGTMFVFLFVGFGTKAGVIPLHKWLPYAHSAAPSNISALMSGVMIKIAVYGVARFVLDVFTPDLWWGVLLMVFGTVTALLGIIYAFKESDLKKLLAYCSIENIGIIFVGLGLYIIFNFYGLELQANLSLLGALFHVLNHAIFKSSLFMTAGSVVRATGTRNIEMMGGLGRVMPFTGAIFLVGACAISALPPLNGFASEVMLFQAYLTSFGLGRPLLEILLFAGLAGLALTSALSAATFAKAYGMVFLARPRSEAAAKAREVPFAMLLAPGILAALCVILGVFSFQLLSRVRGGLPVPNMLPIGVMLAIFAAIAAIAVRLTRAPVRRAETWACGIPDQSGRTEYTASGFSEPIITVFKSIFRTRKTVHYEFSDRFKSVFKSASGEITTLKFFEERIYQPVADLVMRVAAFVSALHNQDLDGLVLYAFVAVVIVILAVGWWL
jgi:hydrogenase-4 component B